MPIIGFRREVAEGALLPLASNKKYLTTVVINQAMRIAKLSAKLDGLAPGGGPDAQPLRGIIYDPAGNLVAESEETLVPVGAALAWFDFRFDNIPGGVAVAAGKYEFGLIAGSPTAAQLATLPGVGVRVSGADTYGSFTTKTTATVTLPVATLEVTSTTGLDPAGEVLVGGKSVRYTSKEATKLKGCTGGSGVVASGSDVTQNGASVLRDQPERPLGDRVNLAIDPNFEGAGTQWVTTGTFWVTTGATISVVGTVTPVDGMKVLKIVTANVAANEGAGLAVSVTKGVPITVSLYLRGAVGGEKVRLGIGDGTVGNANTGYKTLTTAFQRFSVTLTPTATGSTFIGVSLETKAAATFYVDAALIEAVGTMESYFPTVAQLAANEARWQGTANASKSDLASGEYRIFGTYFLDTPTATVDDLHIARYPFTYAQELLGADPPNDISQIAACTWHGTRLNPERGSFLLVQRDGRFSDFIGERVRVMTFTGRSVNAYVLGEAELDEEDDISITRRLFLALAPLATDSMNVRIAVLTANGGE